MHQLLFVAVLLCTSSAVAANRTESVATVKDEARIPTHPNSSCPIMGKPISHKLFTDTPRGRIWVCCKSCIATIQADVDLAYKTAYPSERSIELARCPLTNKAFLTDSPYVVLQGLRFRVFDKDTVKRAVAESQLTVARVMEPSLVDVANPTCPIDGQPVAANAFVVIDGRIVHLSATRHVDEASKAPAKTLQRALEIAAKAR